MSLLSRIKGMFFRSLTWYVDKDVRQTILENKAFKKHDWSFLERNLLCWSGAPFESAFRLFIAILLSINAVFLLNRNLGVNPEYVNAAATVMKPWIPIVMNSQLTILGVLFPLVIGLVGFLLQSKTASRVTWSSYQRYSCVLFAGISGILLAITILISLYLQPYLSEQWISVSYLFFSFWLTFNLSMTAWFLFVTFQIVQDDSRENLLLRFTIVEAFLGGIKSNMFANISDDASSNGILKIDEKYNKCIVNKYGDDRDFSEIAFETKRSRYVSNVYYSILSLFLKYMFKKTDGKVEIKLMPVKPNDQNTKFEAVRIKGYAPNRFDKAFVRLAYSISNKKTYETEMTDYVRFFMVGAAVDDLNKNNAMLFSESMKRISKWHCALTDAFHFIEHGKPQNWLILSEGPFSGDYHTDFLREYFFIVGRAIEKIPDSPRFFEEVVVLHQRLYARSNFGTPTKMVEDLLHSQYLVWVELVKWGSNTKRTNRSYIMEREYEDSLITFIGYWEMWRFYVGGKRSVQVSDFEQFHFSYSQLEKTALMVLFSLSERENISVSWALDTFLHWLKSWEAGRPNHFVGSWREDLIDPSLLKEGIESPVWKFILNGDDYSESAAVSSARKNLWIDFRLLIASIIYEKYGYDAASSGASYINRIINCEFYDSGMSKGGLRDNSIKCSDIFESYLRIKGVWSDDQNYYSARVDRFCNTTQEVGRSKAVMGRLYSGGFGFGIRQIIKAYVRLCTELSNKRWNLSSQWKDLIISEFVSDIQRQDILSDIEAWLKAAKDLFIKKELDPEKYQNFQESINDIKEFVSGFNKDRIEQAEISYEILNHFGFFASKLGFSKDTGSKFLRLFDEIELIPQGIVGDERRVRIVDFNKARISKDIDVDRPVNEEEWFASAIRDSISRNIFGDLYRAGFKQTKCFRNKIDLLMASVEESKRISELRLSPIIILNSPSVSYFLTELSYGLETCPGLEVNNPSLDSDFPFSLNSYPVLDVTFGQEEFCIIVSAESFRTIRFKEYEPGRMVNVGYENLDPENQKVDLVLEYIMECVLSDQLRSLYKLDT